MTITFRHWAEPQVARGTTWPSALGKLRSHATRWMIATVKQVYPIVVVFAIFAVLVAATIALRLAIWLSHHFHS